MSLIPFCYNNINNLLYKCRYFIGRNISISSISQKRSSDPGLELKEKNWQLEFHQIEPNSRSKIYDKKPFKLKIKAGETYKWCSCGFSHSQPLCDGTHSVGQLKITLRPIVFKAPVTKEVWLCNCKRTKNPPFCDGTHRQKEIQEAVK